jgi:hypothetical protein
LWHAELRVVKLFFESAMWHKLLTVFSSVWHTLWSPLLAATLVAASSYLLRRRDERRELRKRLSAEVYIPVRQQLSEAETNIRELKSSLSVDTEMWRRMCTTGIAEKLKATLKLQLEVLYERTIPEHDRAWRNWYDEISRLVSEWDGRYADIPNYAQAIKEHQIVEIVWWDFLTGDVPVIRADGLHPEKVLRLWNGFMTPARFGLLDLNVEQFLIQRWEEMSRNPCLRQYRELRQRALVQIPNAIACISRETVY